MAAAARAKSPVRIASKRETSNVRSRTQEIVERMAFKRASSILANSNAVAGYIRDRGVPAEKIEVIYNGVAADKPARANGFRGKLDLPRDVRIVTLILQSSTRCKERPDVSSRRKTHKWICRRRPFSDAGEGELRTKLESMDRATLGVSDIVHFIGRCSSVPALIASSYAPCVP